MKKVKLFISYKSQDQFKVAPLVERLRQETDFYIWFDMNHFLEGEKIIEILRTAILESNVFLFFLSQYHSEFNLESYTHKELLFALKTRIPILPIKLDADAIKPILISNLEEHDMVGKNFDMNYVGLINNIRLLGKKNFI